MPTVNSLTRRQAARRSGTHSLAPQEESTTVSPSSSSGSRWLLTMISFCLVVKWRP